MLLTPLGLAAFAGISQAFLIPPTLAIAELNPNYTPNAKAVKSVVEAVSWEAVAATESRSLEVDCPGCPVEGAVGTLHNAQSVLRFNVSVEHGTGEDHLMVNGLQVFPIDPQGVMNALKADQMVKKPDGTWAYTASPELGYSMSVKPFHDYSTKGPLSVFTIRLRIIEVGSTFVRGIPSMEMKVVKTPSGKLMIADGNVATSGSRPIFEPKCPSLLCHWKAIVASKVDALKKGCGSRKGGHRRPRPHGIYVAQAEGQGHRAPPHASHPHSHHRRPNLISRLFASFALHVLIPIFVGLALGVTASIVGMVVGHIAIFFWRLLFRRGERGQYCRVKQVGVVEGIDEEGKGFLENQGPSPVYEEGVIVLDEKTESQ